MQTARVLNEEKSSAKRRAELADLQVLATESPRSQRISQFSEDVGEEKERIPDGKNVEKTLVHLFNLMDEKHTGFIQAERLVLALSYSKEYDQRHNDAIKSCGISNAEMRGFIAEAVLNDKNELRYIELVKTWIPILFEIRKIKILHSILEKYEPEATEVSSIISENGGSSNSITRDEDIFKT
ncbi:hypothetical protein IE077_004016 [Cardiosporidium cionae]|uniref:EF-hand domain-containing protein n=1 Tax=Cardiosporidium cionae TaxID=476202 RepID=A0ABQ7J726_9APIC|nr:hypothetical protein IE077_004016 [Cardiosporidium cionae]|eukprot:KAF8819774.1 hypothetical protein IE077_004016 [Cardiosporidium cionae]